VDAENWTVKYRSGQEVSGILNITFDIVNPTRRLHYSVNGVSFVAELLVNSPYKVWKYSGNTKQT
jgi:hypothetical protein